MLNNAWQEYSVSRFMKVLFYIVPISFYDIL